MKTMSAENPARTIHLQAYLSEVAMASLAASSSPLPQGALRDSIFLRQTDLLRGSIRSPVKAVKGFFVLARLIKDVALGFPGRSVQRIYVQELEGYIVFT
jgi:hypothetical protein